MKELSNLTKVVTGSPIRQMFNRAIGMENVVSFTVGEPDFPTPKHIVEAAVTALRSGEHKYTPNAGILALRQAIARHIERSHGLSYMPESEVIVTAGGMEALLLAMLAILDPDDEIIIGDPSWTNYSRQAMICKAKPVFVKVDVDSNFQFDAYRLEAAITEKTKAFLVNSPANPTGSVANLATLEKLAEIAIRHDLYVLSDEVYANLLYGENSAPSIATLPGMRERTILINSFSKTYAMTGWRVGFALAPSKIIQSMITLQESVVSCVNSAAQYAALAALEGTQTPLHEMQRAYQNRREIVVKGFEKIPYLKCFAPQGAFYAFVDISETGMDADTFATKLLETHRVIVVPGHAFGTSGKDYVRLSFATSEEQIREGIRRIGAFVESYMASEPLRIKDENGQSFL